MLMALLLALFLILLLLLLLPLPQFDFNVLRQDRVDQPPNEMTHVSGGIDAEKNHDFEMREVTQEREPKDADFACFYEARAPTIEMEHYQRSETVLPILS